MAIFVFCFRACIGGQGGGESRVEKPLILREQFFGLRFRAAREGAVGRVDCDFVFGKPFFVFCLQSSSGLLGKPMGFLVGRSSVAT